jgi:hypothetical protein
MGERVVNDTRLLNSVNKSRRAFVKKVMVGGGFVAPLLASFPMNGLTATSARAASFGNQECQDCSALTGIARLLCEIENFIRKLLGLC